MRRYPLTCPECASVSKLVVKQHEHESGHTTLIIECNACAWMSHAVQFPTTLLHGVEYYKKHGTFSDNIEKVS